MCLTNAWIKSNRNSFAAPSLFVSLWLNSNSMWHALGKMILRYRIALLIVLAGITGWMGYHASKVQLSYEFTRAIPTDNPKYKSYQAFKSKFGEDGNLLVIGVQTDRFFHDTVFNAYATLMRDLKSVNGRDRAVEDVLSVPGAIGLYRDSVQEKLSIKT
ncbi:MAG: hypothetical protein EBU84_15570 [Actinobacteria bacterium]|nr:hypothetical protein [Actinomycetota bacterium]